MTVFPPDAMASAIEAFLKFENTVERPEPDVEGYGALVEYEAKVLAHTEALAESVQAYRAIRGEAA